MNRLAHTRNNLMRRKTRIRHNISGTAKRPRMTVFISNQNISVQLIDDEKQNTLLQVTTAGSKQPKGTMTDKAIWVGTEIAKKSKAKNIKTVVFDRNGKLYHGRIKALADAARDNGLEL